jgi:transposase
MSVFVPGFQPVGRFFNEIKQCRRMATRYDSLPPNYLAFIQR